MVKMNVDDHQKDSARARKRGATTMEVVVVCVLIAAACLVGVAVFGRALFRNTDVMDKAVNGQGNRAGTALQCPKEGYRKQANDDMQEAVKYNREFSDAKE